MENNVLEPKTDKSYDPTKEDVRNYLLENDTMYNNNGKYFDPYLFNRKFEEYIEQETKERLLSDDIKTNDLEKIENTKIDPYELPLNKIIINTKTMWFNLFDNVINLKSPLDNFTNDDIFYLSISLIIMSLLYIFLYMLFS